MSKWTNLKELTATLEQEIAQKEQNLIQASNNLDLEPSEVKALKEVDWRKELIQIDTEFVYKTVTERTANPPQYKYESYKDQDCLSRQDWNTVGAIFSFGISSALGSGPDSSRCNRKRRVRLPTTYNTVTRRIKVGEKPIMEERVSKYLII